MSFLFWSMTPSTVPGVVQHPHRRTPGQSATTVAVGLRNGILRTFVKPIARHWTGARAFSPHSASVIDRHIGREIPTRHDVVDRSLRARRPLPALQAMNPDDPYCERSSDLKRRLN